MRAKATYVYTLPPTSLLVVTITTASSPWPSEVTAATLKTYSVDGVRGYMVREVLSVVVWPCSLKLIYTSSLDTQSTTPE